MAIEVLIGDRFGRIIAEVRPAIDPISWRLNKVGKTKLTLAKTDAKATRDNFQYGNRVLIRFSDDVGLPYWGGTMEPPMEWSKTTVGMPCYGIEYLLQHRHTAKTRAFYSASVGKIFQELLRETQLDDPLGIEIGQVWLGGSSHQPRYHFKSLWWVIKNSLIKMEGCDVRFVPFLQAGKIRFRAELWEALGADLSGKRVFKEGRNVEDTRLTDQGPIVNEFAAIGSGSTWGVERQVSVMRADSSRDKYGLRQDSEIFSGVVLQPTLDRHAETEVEETAEGRTRLTLKVTNDPPARFKDYRIGDSLRCVLPGWDWDGYDETVRVATREYTPQGGRCECVVEEKRDVDVVYIGSDADATEE